MMYAVCNVLCGTGNGVRAVKEGELLTPTLDFGAQDLGGESLSTLDFVSSTCRWDITVAAACNMRYTIW